MAGLQSLYFENVTLTIAAGDPGSGEAFDVSCAGTGATLTGDTPIEDRKKLCGAGKAAGTTSWSWDFTFDQDWDDPDGASWFLFHNVGKEATLEASWDAGAVVATTRVIVTPGPFGGTAGEVAEGTVTLPALGAPDIKPLVPAASATAGTPGTFSPTGAAAPRDLGALQSGTVTASPTTAWTTGQYVTLADDTDAHWSGTAWASGKG